MSLKNSEIQARFYEEKVDNVYRVIAISIQKIEAQECMIPIILTYQPDMAHLFKQVAPSWKVEVPTVVG